MSKYRNFACPDNDRMPANCHFCGRYDKKAIFMMCKICKVTFPEGICSRCFIANKDDIIITRHFKNDSEMHQSVELI